VITSQTKQANGLAACIAKDAYIMINSVMHMQQSSVNQLKEQIKYKTNTV